LKVVALAGGTGSAKLLRGLDKLRIDLTVVANVGDNVWMYGLYVCPDIDIACYTLAGVADRARGWGIQGDSHRSLEQLAKLGTPTWFKLGDMDMATCLFRTRLLREGATLTQATRSICSALGVSRNVIPVTDDPVETRIVTPQGDMHLQEFWVRDGGRPSVTRVWYRGARGAMVTEEVKAALEGADRVVLCPANPVTSIGPMLAVPGFRTGLAGCEAKVVALSPMVGTSPFSGPAGKLMKAVGIRADSLGVAKLYSGFLDSLIISDGDVSLKEDIASLGIDCSLADTRMTAASDELRLAKKVLKA
jgi:LPPG:FO 2-phospho-L-lactate transferase